MAVGCLLTRVSMVDLVEGISMYYLSIVSSAHIDILVGLKVPDGE